MPKVNSKLKAADPWLKWLIIAGTATYFVEVTTGISEGNIGHSVFWWVQSFIAVCFTVEYILRWVDDAHDQYRWRYPNSASRWNSERNAKGSLFAGRKNKPTGFYWYAAILNVSIDPFP